MEELGYQADSSAQTLVISHLAGKWISRHLEVSCDCFFKLLQLVMILIYIYRAPSFSSPRSVGNEKYFLIPFDQRDGVTEWPV